MKTNISAMGLAYAVNKDGATCRIVGMGTFVERALILPEKLDGYRVNSIAAGAFRGCSELESVEIGEGLVSIGSESFCGCSGLTRVKIADSVREIGWGAFLDCIALTDISLGNGLEEIGGCAFFGCGACAEIPPSTSHIGEQSFCGTSGITVAEENPHFASADGHLYTKDMKILLQYATGKQVPCFTVPDSVEEIGCFAFGGAVRLSAVRFGKNVKTVGSNAFHACTALWAVNLPDSVREIGDSAFYGCASLSAVSIGKETKRIGRGAFGNCPKLDAIRRRGKMPLWEKVIFGKKENPNAPFREIRCGKLKFKFLF